MAKYCISSATALFELACQAGLPVIDTTQDQIDRYTVWEVALPTDPKDPYNDRGRGETYITVVQHAGGFELTVDQRVLRVGGTREELQTALQWLAGAPPEVICGGGTPPLAA